MSTESGTLSTMSGRMSICPVKRLSTTSGNKQKTVNRNQEKTPCTGFRAIVPTCHLQNSHTAKLVTIIFIYIIFIIINYNINKYILPLNFYSLHPIKTKNQNGTIKRVQMNAAFNLSSVSAINKVKWHDGTLARLTKTHLFDLWSI